MSPEGCPQTSSDGRLSKSLSPKLRMAGGGGSQLQGLDCHIKRRTAKQNSREQHFYAFFVACFLWWSPSILSVSFSRDDISIPLAMSVPLCSYLGYRKHLVPTDILLFLCNVS